MAGFEKLTLSLNALIETLPRTLRIIDAERRYKVPGEFKSRNVLTQVRGKAWREVEKLIRRGTNRKGLHRHDAHANP
ncbi:MAG: hypothetical protein DMG40_11605 [Acidobacteria bacterium]|nr:MAG: hypothetical protein DMG40_11605 [Acidobacteriota bacterium]